MAHSDTQAKAKEHYLAVCLLPEEWKFLGEKAEGLGLSRSQLIGQFIKDFAGYRRNGSDEGEAAAAWYDRSACNYRSW